MVRYVFKAQYKRQAWTYITLWCGLKHKLFQTKFGDLLTTGGGPVQPAKYTVFDEGSESEVQNVQILQESLKISISKF